MFRYLVLGLLRDGRPRHGWALLAEYRARAGVEINSGSFYRELQRLVADRLARFADVVEEDARRRPYVILDAGRSAFDRWVASRLATVEPAADDEVACRAVFLAGGDRGRMRAALSEWQEQLWIAGKTLERDRLVSVERGADGGVRDEVLSLLLARRIKHVAADLEFVAEAASLFESLCERDDAALGVARADADSDEHAGGGDAAWDVGVAPETPLALAAAAGAGAAGGRDATIVPGASTPPPLPSAAIKRAPASASPPPAGKSRARRTQA